MFKTKPPLPPFRKGGMGKHGSFGESNVFRLLKTFSKDDMREFEKLVKSPFHNNRSEATNFFLEVKKYYPAFNQKNFSKEKVYGKLYPKSKYKDDVMRRLSNYLLKLGEEYIAHNKLRKNKYYYEKNILDYYSAVNMDSFFFKQLKKVESYLEEQKSRGARYFERVYDIGVIKRVYSEKKETTHKNSNLVTDIDNLLQFSVISLLRLYILIAYIEKHFSQKNDCKYLGHLLKIINEPGFVKSEAAEMFYLALKLTTDSRNDETFFKLKDILQNHANIFDDDEECHVLFTSLLDYCFDKKMVLDKDYTLYEFELAKQMLEMGMLTEGEQIHPEWFIYIVQRAITVGELKYAEKFIEDYKSIIAGKEKDNVINHAYALLAMVKKDFKKALEYLSTTKYNNTLEKLRINYMYMTIYYEADMYESFLYTADSFKHLLRNDLSVSKGVKLLYENFIKHVSKLYRLKLKEIDIPLAQLRKEIIGSQVMGIKWLLKRIDELEK